MESNKLKRVIYLLILLVIVLGTLAYPTVMVILEDRDAVSKTVTLEGPAVDEQWEFTKDVAELIQYADDLGYQLSFGEVWRTMYQQRHNVAIGVSWTYNSKHLKRRAVDFNLFIDGKYAQSVEDYRILGEYWESLNPKNVWGGRWKRTPDAPHFQRSD